MDNDYATEYVYTGTPVVAFWRRKGGSTRFAAVNLSGEPVRFDAPASARLAEAQRVYRQAALQSGSVSLGGFGSAVWVLEQA